MSRPTYATLDDWVARETTLFSLNSLDTFNEAVDKVIASLGDSVELLGFGEALHGGEEILILRNCLFQHLVEKHGYSAIAIESSFPKALLVDDYISWRGPASYEEVKDAGFGHAFGCLEANRELVEWMRQYNADPLHHIKVHFYGFDIPSGANGIASPRQVLEFALNYLSSVDNSASLQERHHRVNSLIREDAQWENPAAYMNPSESIALSPDAAALRIETEDLITEFRTRMPELVAGSSQDQYLEALHHALVARQLLNFHAALAGRVPGKSPARVLGVRDALMADTLAYIVERERGRGKVMAFAHNGHLQRGKAIWPGQKYWGTEDPCEWWPAGSLLNEMMKTHYKVIGSAVGCSEENGIGSPEDGTLESRLINASPGPARFIATHKGQGLPAAEIAALPTRSGSIKNPTYTPLSQKSFTDFDWLAILDSITYNRGGPPLQQWDPKAQTVDEKPKNED